MLLHGLLLQGLLLGRWDCPALGIGVKREGFGAQGGIPELLSAGWDLCLLKAEGWDIQLLN